jgi:hypothetical protein
MMDYENKQGDFIHEKLSKTIEKSNNLLHKKAVALIKGLKEQLGQKSEGIEGIKNYTKNLLDLIDLLYKKISNPRNYTDELSMEEDVKNSEALVFTLAVCIKQLPFALLRNEKILERLIQTVEKFLKISSIVPKRVELKKYSMIIAEKLLLSRSEDELKNENDPVLKFFSEIYFTLLDESASHSETELQKCLIKNLSKILKTANMTNILKMTILLQIKNYLIRKIRGLNTGKDYEGNTLKAVGGYEAKIKQLSTSEGENVLKFMCSILQFLPFEIVNDLILELTELIVVSENKHVLLNSLLCFEVAFNTKNFALETSEKIIKLLLSKDFLINTNEDFEKEKEKPVGNVDINTSLTIAFMKSTTGVLLNLSRLNIFLGMKLFTSVFSLLGEFLTSSDDFLRSSVFNCLQSIFNSLMSKKNMVILFSSITKKSNHKDSMNLDPNELTFDINISNQSSQPENNVINILENISENLLYLTSDRFEDLKLGFNLLHNFLEKISTFTEIVSSTEEKIQIGHIVNPIIENILTKLSENEGESGKDKLQKSQTFKVFLGKIFNFISSSVILKLFPLQVLDFDICSEEYTENSKVWIISFIDKFLRSDSHQSVREFYESFIITIEELEKAILKLKSGRDYDDMEEDDERFQFNNNETQHVRLIKIKRYELILQQVWSLLTKFTNWNENYDVYVKEILKKFENIISTYNKDTTSIFIPNIRETIFKVIAKLISVSFKRGDMKTLEVIKQDGKIFFSKCLNMIIKQKLSKSELKDSFNLISAFCKIMSEKFLFKIICDMIEKFDKSFQTTFIQNDNVSNFSNKAKLNESVDISIDNVEMVDTKKKPSQDKKSKDKEITLLSLRIDIINYILKNVKLFKNPTHDETQPAESNLFSLLNSFFEKFFFNERINNQPSIRKKLIDLFMILMGKMESSDQILDIFSKFVNEYKGLDNLTAKQKAKLFDFIVNILLKKFEQEQNISKSSVDITECFAQLHILIEIVSLTKDMNRKVRNLAYEMIGKITEFMSETNLFNEWIKMILAILASNSSYLKSASINALARIFWQKRNTGDNHLHKLLIDTSNVILLLLKENNKEITKSIFLFVRVLLYLNKNLFSGHQETSGFINKIITAIFHDSNEDIKKEFKVKMRNLLKNLIIKFSYEEIKNLIPKDVESLLAYINKHVVKKIKTMTKEEEGVYGGSNSLDHSVMMDNDENLLDEEEEYIEKEFKKLEKRKNDEEKFFERLEKLQLEEDDPELVKKKMEAENNRNEKLDKIEQLFSKDNVRKNFKNNF